ncbi:MAG: HAD family hydrolase [Pigeon pea little leaf phytoplasma]|uniref:Cof-type HAD-IIB family hydrolase n=1 Tax=Candidatus Phytoplasma fabacearum TaxID=2982628 RepID=A0ABU8ZRR3_9MOLU|nr:HAD family hydrolase ['Bituminaria bituminosa' little leaf phytoplasma]MDV3148686.1 HAD family hydrolase [Pigeon pea little leaf phytoplasma]MDO7983490.1 Cof-type HAD-IIB family hydrolase ['Bituminaria bituminosa' little leaf phytoplasma]MDO8023883.1 Cof-type HAD-IIB family hydrolase ['Bituminaria bituminosa' little leaf phytoplasma]MDO8030506.1 Cof-type HAD-IIB family hydrolase ['Bituminaria bituminosa' little leaf phytoplasma]MDV3154020.1 HAD family hydrolase [Pigeon pea little leaf phyto
MKRIYFFDIDQTLYHNNKKTILPQTKKLILALANKPGIILGIATGRNYRNLNVLGDLISCFKYFVIMNGAVTISKNDGIINENPIPSKYIECFVNKIKNFNILLAGVNIDKEVILYNPNLSDQSLINYYQKELNYDVVYDLKFMSKIYFMVALGSDVKKIKNFRNDLSFLNICFWNSHADLTVDYVNKYYGISKIKSKYPDYQLICTGDGSNDIEMLSYADIGIAMGNSLYPRTKEVAKFIAPHIDSDQLYDFFKKNIFI